MIRKMVELKEFDELEIGNDKILISYLQFVDDTVLLDKASVKNVKCLGGILKLFEISPELKFNFQKSSMHVIHLKNQQLEALEDVLKCNVDKFPFTYLGLPIGANFRKKGSM